MRGGTAALMVWALLGAGCGFVFRASAPMGPSMVDATAKPNDIGEVWAGGKTRVLADSVFGERWVGLGGGGGIDLSLGKGLSLVFEGEMDLLPQGGPTGRNRVGLRGRAFNHLYVGGGVSPMFGLLGVPYVAGDLEFGGSVNFGPAFLSTGVRLAVSLPVRCWECSDPFLYGLPSIGVGFRPEALPVGPYVQAGGHYGRSLRTRGWDSWEANVWFGVQGRFGPPEQPHRRLATRSLE